MASFGTHFRREWFGTACCPANIARLTASVGDYIYATSSTGLWVNLFIASKTTIVIGKQSVDIELETNYPWDGKGKLTVNPQRKGQFDLRIRVPGWAQNHPVPGDLYRFTENQRIAITFKINGKPIQPDVINGYALVRRTWQRGDIVEWEFPMEVKEVVAHAQVKQNTDRVALQRGPLVYCVEGADNGGKAWDFIVPDGTNYRAEFKPDLLGGVVTITFEVQAFTGGDSPTGVVHYPKTITAIPYYAWNNRGANEMQVWLPKKIKEIRINPEN